MLALEYASHSFPDLGWRIAPPSDGDGDGDDVPDIAIARYTPAALAPANERAVVFSSGTWCELFRVACGDSRSGASGPERP